MKTMTIKTTDNSIEIWSGKQRLSIAVVKNLDITLDLIAYYAYITKHNFNGFGLNKYKIKTNLDIKNTIMWKAMEKNFGGQ